MSSVPQLDFVGLSDPIISSGSSALSPTQSPITTSYSSVSGTSISRSHHTPGMAITEEPIIVGEREPLLNDSNSTRPVKKPFYRPRPLWLVPFAIISSLVRGMTLAPRVEVFTQLACGTIHSHYNHTTVSSDSTVLSSAYNLNNSFIPLYMTLDPVAPHNIIPIRSLDTEGDDGEDDPRTLPSQRCMSDPAVQAGAARLQTIMTTTMGTLSALTTGWWGHFGERHGRTRVLAFSSLGLFLTDLTFILVSTPHTPFATHGHKLLVLAPFIEGLLGGWSTLQSATTAYISDCTSDGSRAQIFSRFTGVFYLGLSAGPAIGAFLIKHPFMPFNKTVDVHPIQSVTSVFWVAIFCSFINVILTTFFFPESLPVEKRQTKPTNAGEESPKQTSQDWVGFGIVKGFLTPLALFLPKVVASAEGGGKRDWSLTFLALSLFGYMLSTGVFQIKYMYAEHVYGWGAEQLSYYISWLGALRAVHLLFILPFIIVTFKPKPKTKPSMLKPGTALKPKPTRAVLAQEMHFDLFLTRLCFILDILSNTFVVLSPSPSATIHALSTRTASSYSQIMFVAASSLSSFGSGVVPAVQSLALCILQSRSISNANAGCNEEDVGIGRLFGALAVLQAVGQMIIGPLIFGFIYSATVATFPKAIFTTAGGICVVSLAFVFLIRPVVGPKGKRRRVQSEVEIERGRSRVSKDLRWGVPERGEGEASGSGSFL